MAVKEQTKILRRGVAAWNAWRRNHPGETIDLKEDHLSYTDLSQINLEEATLIRTGFREANLSHANLRGVDLSHANLREANLSHANLREANLSHANLREANLREADLSYSHLREADLSYAHLTGANLIGVHLLKTDLSYAELTGANLKNALIGWTILGSLDLRAVKGLETIQHAGPSIIGTDTLSRSYGDIPEIFLRGAGLDNNFLEYVHALTNKPIEYYTCFISYSSKDELFARRLHNDLQQEGVRCWFAPEDMDIGDKIRHRIEESIRLYDKLLLILSEHSIASNWVAYEVERAVNKEPQGIPNVLYPVSVDKAIMTCTTTWAYDIKSSRHIGNFERWTDPQQYEKSFKRLLRALNTKKEQQKN